jgi:hypothetical protein
MNTIKIGEIDLTLGLLWTRVGAENQKKEIGEISTNLRSPFGVVRQSVDKTHIGLIDEEKANKTFSAAALVAEIVTDCVLVEKVGDDRYWICCVMNGEVIPGSDEVSNSDRMSSKVDEFSDVPSFDGEEIIIYASEEVCDEVGIKAHHHLSLEDILEEYGDYKNKLPLAKIVRLNSNLKSILIGLGVLTVVGSGLGINYWLDAREASRELAAYNLMLSKNSNIKKGPARISDEIILSNAYDEELVIIDKKFNEQSLQYALPTYLEIMKTRVKNNELGGWIINDISLKFGASGKAIIRASWSSTGEGNHQSLIHLIDADNHTISGDGRDAVTHYEFKKNDVFFDNYYEKIIKDAEDIRVELIDELINIEVSFDIKGKTNGLRHKSIDRLSKEDVRFNQRVAVYTSREFSMKGEGLGLLEALNEVLSNEKYSHMILNKVITKINNDNVFSWSLSGVIYEN